MLTATVTGNLGTDPELKYSANGSPFLRFSVASNGRVKDSNGDWVDSVEWVRCTVLGQRAESLGQHLRKGQRVCVVGKLEARPWTDQQGGVRAGLELTASEIDFMSSRNDEGGQQQQQAARPQQQQQARPQQGQQQQQQRGRSGPSGRQMPESVAVHGGRGPQQRSMDDGGDLDDLPF